MSVIFTNAQLWSVCVCIGLFLTYTEHRHVLNRFAPADFLLQLSLAATLRQICNLKHIKHIKPLAFHILTAVILSRLIYRYIYY